MRGIPTRYRGVHAEDWSDIDPDTGHGYGAIAQNYVLFMAEVEVEPATGKTRVLGATIVADIGTVGSRQAVLGQAWGGFSHAVGFALSENYEDMKKHASLRGARVPRCNDVPDTFTVLFHETFPRERAARIDGPRGRFSKRGPCGHPERHRRGRGRTGSHAPRYAGEAQGLPWTHRRKGSPPDKPRGIWDAAFMSVWNRCARSTPPPERGPIPEKGKRALAHKEVGLGKQE